MIKIKNISFLNYITRRDKRSNQKVNRHRGSTRGLSAPGDWATEFINSIFLENLKLITIIIAWIWIWLFHLLQLNLID